MVGRDGLGLIISLGPNCFKCHSPPPFNYSPTRLWHVRVTTVFIFGLITDEFTRYQLLTLTKSEFQVKIHSTNAQPRENLDCWELLKIGALKMMANYVRPDCHSSCQQTNAAIDFSHFLAVQHERAPRSTQSSLHHYPLGFSTRFRTLQNSAVFSNLPLHLQNPQLLEPTLSPVSSLTSHYLHQGLIYPGMLGAFSKPTGTMHSGVSK